MAVQAIQQFKNKEKDRAVSHKQQLTKLQGGSNGNITKCWWCG